MSDKTRDQVIELALQLTIPEQAKLLERVAANIAHEVAPTRQIDLESLAGRTFEVWSPQDEGGTVAAMNQVLREHK
jgi:hypothetical protein